MPKKTAEELRPGRIVADCGKDDRTIQSDREFTNIKTLMAQQYQTGMCTHINRAQPHVGDFRSAEDLHTTLNRANRARSEFLDLPAHVRDACDHDPVRFLELAATEEGLDHLVKAGLPEAPAEPTPIPANPPPGSPEPANPGPEVENAGPE